MYLLITLARKWKKFTHGAIKTHSMLYFSNSLFDIHILSNISYSLFYFTGFIKTFYTTFCNYLFRTNWRYCRMRFTTLQSSNTMSPSCACLSMRFRNNSTRIKSTTSNSYKSARKSKAFQWTWDKVCVHI